MNGNAPDAESKALFREYLRGAMLRYLYSAPGATVQKQGANQEKIVSFCAELVKAKKEQAPLIPDKIASAFTVVDVTGDGNCLFRAISRARGPNENLHENYRLMAAGQVARTYDIATICAATSVQY